MCYIFIKNGGGYVDYTVCISCHNFCNKFWKNFCHIYDTAEVTACIVTHLQFENIQMIFVKDSNPRIVVMARAKSSLCMYTSTTMPRYDALAHIVTVIMYTA